MLVMGERYDRNRTSDIVEVAKTVREAHLSILCLPKMMAFRSARACRLN